MKKRNLFLVLLLTLVMCLSACGEEETSRRKRSSDDDEKIEETTEEKKTEEEETTGETVPETEETIMEEESEKAESDEDSDGKTFEITKDLSVDNAGVKINKYWVTKDYSNKEEDIVCLEITYTNNADRDRSFWHNTTLLAYQGGVRLDYGSEEEGTDDDVYVQIQPGTAVTFTHAFTLRDTTTDVELKFSSPYNTGFQKYESECTLSIK